MANIAGTRGKLTKFKVSTDGTTFSDMCIFGDLVIDFGSEALNKEYCINSLDPYVSLGNNEFADQTYISVWNEDDTIAVGNAIVRTAKEADTLAGSTIHVQVEMNNSKGAGKKGTLFDYTAVVGSYKILAQEQGVVKAEFTMAQSTVPVKTAAEAP